MASLDIRDGFIPCHFTEHHVTAAPDMQQHAGVCSSTTGAGDYKCDIHGGPLRLAASLNAAARRCSKNVHFETPSNKNSMYIVITSGRKAAAMWVLSIRPQALHDVKTRWTSRCRDVTDAERRGDRRKETWGEASLHFNEINHFTFLFGLSTY